MNKIYFLSTCSTCTRIIREIQNCSNSEFEMHDIKQTPVSESELELFYAQEGAYEGLFNKRAQKYALIPEKDRPKSDIDYKALILSEYTFLKRPVIQINSKYFFGNAKKTLEAIKSALNCKK